MPLPECTEEPCQALYEAWKEATIAWAVCASIHREYAKGKDALFTTRQADFQRHEDEARANALKYSPPLT